MFPERQIDLVGEILLLQRHSYLGIETELSPDANKLKQNYT